MKPSASGPTLPTRSNPSPDALTPHGAHPESLFCLPAVSQKTVCMPSQPFNVVSHLESAGRLLSVDEVAEILSLSKYTIYRMAQKRQIPSLMLGGTRKFDPSTLIAWLAKKEPQLTVVARQLRQQSA